MMSIEVRGLSHKPEYARQQETRYAAMTKEEIVKIERAANEFRVTLHTDKFLFKETTPIRRAFFWEGHEFAWDTVNEVWVLFWAHRHDGTCFNGWMERAKKRGDLK